MTAGRCRPGCGIGSAGLAAAVRLLACRGAGAAGRTGAELVEVGTSASSLQGRRSGRPVRCVRQDNTDALFDHAVEVGRTTGLIHPDDIVVITAGIPLGASGTTNMLKVQTVR